MATQLETDDYANQLEEARSWWVAEERLSRVIQSMGSDADDALALDAAFARWDRCEAIFGIRVADQLRLEADLKLPDQTASASATSKDAQTAAVASPETTGAKAPTRKPPEPAPVSPSSGAPTVTAAPTRKPSEPAPVSPSPSAAGSASAARVAPGPSTPTPVDEAARPERVAGTKPAAKAATPKAVEPEPVEPVPAVAKSGIRTPFKSEPGEPVPAVAKPAIRTPFKSEPGKPAPAVAKSAIRTPFTPKPAGPIEQVSAKGSPLVENGFLSATSDRVPGSVVPEQFVSKRNVTTAPASVHPSAPSASRQPDPNVALGESADFLRKSRAYMALGLLLISCGAIGGFFALRARSGGDAGPATAAAVSLTTCDSSRASARLVNPYKQPATFDVLVEFSDASSELFPASVQVNIGADEAAIIDVPIGGVVLDEASLRCTAVVTKAVIG